MSFRRPAFWIIASAALTTSGALAQTNHFEVEPNDTKADAIANGPIVLSPGDTITGVTTSAAGTGLDNFMIKTAVMTPGVYKHTLTLTTGTTGHTVTLRALNQTATAVAYWPGAVSTLGSTDSVGQTAATVGNTRVLQWYGFGKEEQVYVRVTGTTATAGEYILTLQTEQVTDITDCGKWMQGTLTLSSIPPGTGNDVDMWVYDSNFNPIVGYGNDGCHTFGGAPSNLNTSAQLRRYFGPGTYYLASSNFDLINNRTAACDDNRRTGMVSEFPDAVWCSSATAPVHVHFTITDNAGSTNITSTKLNAFDVRWHKFTVGGTDFGACQMTDGSCVQMDADRCGSAAVGGVFQGAGTSCAALPLPPSAWAARSPAPYARVAAAGALVGDDFYLLLGGNPGGARSTDCWRLDLVENQWWPIAPAPHSGSVAPNIGGASNVDAAVIGTDIYLVGGYIGNAATVISRVLRYDTLTDTWTEITSDPYPTPIYGSGIVSHGGKLYVISGATAVGAPTTACYAYDPAAPEGTRWSPIAPIPAGRAYVAATVINGKIYAATGEATDQSRVDIYDIASNTWVQGPDLTAARGGATIYELDGKPYVVGGGWTAPFLATGEHLPDEVWVAAPSAIQPMRSSAYDGNANWLVRSTGFSGTYRTNTEVMPIAAGNPCPGNQCGPADYNGDGDVGTDQDIEAFFACLGGNCCPTCWCQGADFNGDGDVGTDQDIEAYFRVLGGGTC